MADGKKSFIAYCDWRGVFDSLPDEIAGKLIKHIFAYVEDENPQSEDYVINAVFSPIKAALKRDLEKWENQITQRKEAGRRSAELRKAKMNERSISLNETERNSTVNDNVNVNVNDNVINNTIEREVEKNVVDDAPASQPHSQRKSLEEKIADRVKREKVFYKDVASFKNEYTREMLRAFYDYWREPNKSGSKMKYELEKTWDLSRRLARWQNQERSFNKSSTNEPPQTAIDPRIAEKLQSSATN